MYWDVICDKMQMWCRCLGVVAVAVTVTGRRTGTECVVLCQVSGCDMCTCLSLYAVSTVSGVLPILSYCSILTPMNPFL